MRGFHNGNGQGDAGYDLPPERDSGEPGERFSFIYPEDFRLIPRQWLVRGLLPRRGPLVW